MSLVVRGIEADCVAIVGTAGFFWRYVYKNIYIFFKLYNGFFFRVRTFKFVCNLLRVLSVC